MGLRVHVLKRERDYINIFKRRIQRVVMTQEINLGTRVEMEDREQPLDATGYFRFKKVYEGEYIKMICHIAEVAGLDFGAPKDSIYRVTCYSKDRDNFYIVQEQLDYE